MIKKIKSIYHLVKLGLNDNSALETYNSGLRLKKDRNYIKSNEINKQQSESLSRTEVINYLIKTFFKDCTYLEIGVRNPNDNFDFILSNKKTSVDPGVEFKLNPVDF